MTRMLDGLAAIDAVTLYGSARERTPTAMFNVAGRSSAEVADALAADHVAVWHGNYYAVELERLLGLEPDGAVRAGLVHYNDESDVDRLLESVARLG
jgi:selenocysteine lyase/cysteine desulfurase